MRMNIDGRDAASERKRGRTARRLLRIFQGVRSVRDGAQPCAKSDFCGCADGSSRTVADGPSRTIPAHCPFAVRSARPTVQICSRASILAGGGRVQSSYEPVIAPARRRESAAASPSWPGEPDRAEEHEQPLQRHRQRRGEQGELEPGHENVVHDEDSVAVGVKTGERIRLRPRESHVQPQACH